MAFSSPVFTLEREAGVATVWLDRPESRNAMGPEFWSDLPRAMAEAAEDDDVRAVVLAARGPHFSVGLDLKAMGANLTPDRGGDRSSGVSRRAAFLRDVRRLQGSVTAVADCPKPVVAAVQGACLGGGIDLISACDVRLASADAFFSIRETRIAIVADVGTLQRLPGIIGAGHLAELAYTGKDVDAARAREIGLVNDVLADQDALVAAALAMAGEMAANSPLAVQGTKAVLRAGAGRSVEEGLEYVALWNAAFLDSDDLREALAAFGEKRPPSFRGR